MPIRNADKRHALRPVSLIQHQRVKARCFLWILVMTPTTPFQISELAKATRMPVDAVRFALNATRIKQNADGSCNFPAQGSELYFRFLHVLMSRPKNAAERILFDLKRGIV